MSRRFRDQHSPTSSTRTAGCQTHHSPAPAPLFSRFARPSSSTQHPVPTPGSRTARFRERPPVTDDIETSFERTDQSSPPPPSRSRFSSSVSRRQELVEDLDEDEDEDEDGTRNRFARQRGHECLTREDDDDGLADLEFLETLRGTRAAPTLIETDTESSSPESESFMPTISRKRRRLDNRTDHDLNSIEGDDLVEQHRLVKSIVSNNNKNQDEEDQLNGLSSSDLDTPPSPAVATSGQASSKLSSRFKIPAKNPAASTSAPASLNHSSTGGRNPPRPSFRPTPNYHHHPATSGAPSNQLPPTFSPPRRRGGGQGKDYLPGGAADTVRNWILGLASADQQQQRRGQGRRDIERVRIASELAGTARCVLARDDVGRKWCLIGPGRSGEADRSMSGIGKALGVRMGWDLDLSLNHVDGHEGGGGGGGTGREDVWKVAVLWDILDG